MRPLVSVATETSKTPETDSTHRLPRTLPTLHLRRAHLRWTAPKIVGVHLHRFTTMRMHACLASRPTRSTELTRSRRRSVATPRPRRTLPSPTTARSRIVRLRGLSKDVEVHVCLTSANTPSTNPTPRQRRTRLPLTLRQPQSPVVHLHGFSRVVGVHVCPSASTTPSTNATYYI